MSNSENTKVTSVGASSGSFEDQKSSWEDIQTGKVGNYIHNVEYPTVVDITANSPQDQESKVPSVQNTNDAQDSFSQNMTSSGHTKVQNADQTSNVARGGNSSQDDLDRRPNFLNFMQNIKKNGTRITHPMKLDQ